MLINRQGKVRLMKWYENFMLNDRAKYMREVFYYCLHTLDFCNGHRKIK